MKPHTPEQLEGLRSFVESQSSCESYARLEIDELEVVYSVIHLSEESRPFPYAVAAVVVPSESGEEYEIAVSDDVPEDLRGLWAWHELHDFAVIGHQAEHRCLTSEKVAIGAIEDQPELLDKYLKRRVEFYDGLIGYLVNDLEQNGDKSQYDSLDVDGAAAAIGYLVTKTRE